MPFSINRKLLLRSLISLLNPFKGGGLVLAIGITSCLIIFQYVAFERSYDSFNKNADHIVRLRLDIHDQGKLTMQSAAVFPGVPPLLKQDLPEVENYCRLVSAMISWNNDPVQNNVVLSNDEQNIRVMDNRGFYADASMLQMFTLRLTKGDEASALDGPNKIILSETTAKKYFGDEEPVGKKLTVRNAGNVNYYLVTAVFKDYPANAHLSFDYLISYASFIQHARNKNVPKFMDPETSLGWYDFYDYLQLKKGADTKQFDEKLKSFADRYLNTDRMRLHNNREDLYSISLRDIHLYSNFNEEAQPNGDGRSVSFLFLIAFLIIAIAWVNYTNLTTARSLERAKEVGVRKVLGAMRNDLVSQFLLESFLMNIFALVLALIATSFLAPSFNRLFGIETSWGIHLPLSYWEGFLTLFLCGSFISGIYPAFVLSAYNPITVLKGIFKNSGKGMAVRKTLIVGQFVVSIILIAGTIIVFQQVNYMRNQKLGANINQTLIVNGPGTTPDSVYAATYRPFKNEIEQTTGVRSIAASSTIPGREIYLTSSASLFSSKTKNPLTFYFMYVDQDFLSSYEMDFKSGRNFSRAYTTDQKAAILNEEAMRQFGINDPKAALNEYVNNYRDSLKVIGVVRNYHQLGLNKAIMPIIFLLQPAVNNYYSIKLQNANVHEAISAIEKKWNEYFPSYPFSYFFLDESFNSQYKADAQFGKVFGLFSFLAIFIACFGLLSLSAYNVLQRTREIGIRKVLGASIYNLLFLLSKDFLILVVVALFIAVPACWLIMSRWLNDYAYRIRISWFVFIIAGLLALVIALTTIILQSLKAVTINPVKQLKRE